MAFPNLVTRPGGVQWCEATGVPVNGPNAIQLAFDAPIDPAWVDVQIVALGPSITGVTNLGIVGNVLTLSFVQAGADQAQVTAHLEHTLGR
jgi:hypothetical protein